MFYVLVVLLFRVPARAEADLHFAERFAVGAMHAQVRSVSASPALFDPAHFVLASQPPVTDPEVLVLRAPHAGTLVLNAPLDVALSVTVQATFAVARSVGAYLSLVQHGFTGEEQSSKQRNEHNG